MSFKSIVEAVNEFRSSEDEIMFIHIREPEEIKRAVEEFGAKSLLIRRKEVATITSNYSDANVENYEYDYIIENNTLEQLEIDAQKFKKNLIDSNNFNKNYIKK